MQHLLAWFGAHPLRPAIVSIVAILALGALAPMAEPARNDRYWYPYLSHTSHLTMTSDGAGFTVTAVSDWSYARTGETAQSYIEASYAFDQLRHVWFMLEPQPGSQLAAHTLLLFEFEGDRLLGLTIEARREVNEEYDAGRGLFNAFELAYIWGTARDFLTRRSVMLDHEVFVYPLTLSEAQRRSLLVHLLARTQSLETRPRYYNTILSNCTNELAKATDLEWTPEFVFTGRSDEFLFARGVIPGDNFTQAHARSDVTDYVTALNSAPQSRFDAELLAELRRRFAISTP